METQSEYIKGLLEIIKKAKKTETGKIICHGVLRRVSSSRTLRSISLFLILEKPKKGESPVLCIDWYVTRILGLKDDKKSDGFLVHGCGQDMGFATAYRLGETIYPNGTTKPHGKRNGEADKDGGYAFQFLWL